MTVNVCDIVRKTCDMTTNIVISFWKTCEYDIKCCDIGHETCDMTTNVVIKF